MATKEATIERYRGLLRLLEVSLGFAFGQVDEYFGEDSTPVVKKLCNELEAQYLQWESLGRPKDLDDPFSEVFKDFNAEVQHPKISEYWVSIQIQIWESAISLVMRFKNQKLLELLGSTQFAMLVTETPDYMAPRFILSAEDFDIFKKLEAKRESKYRIGTEDNRDYNSLRVVI